MGDCNSSESTVTVPVTSKEENPDSNFIGGINPLQSFVDEHWKKYDTENAGILEKDKVKQMVKENGGGDLNEDKFETCFSAVDKDGSGKMNKDDFLAFYKEYKA